MGPLLLPVLGPHPLDNSAGPMNAASLIVSSYSPWCYLFPLDLRLFLLPLPQKSLIAERRDLMPTSHLCLVGPRSLTLGTFSGCESL